MYKKCVMALLSLCFLGFIRPQAFSQTALEGVREISLQETTELALRNNFDIQLAKYDIQISRLNIQSAKSVYDTILEAEASHTKDKLASNSILAAGKTMSQDYSIGLSKKLPTGTTVSLDQTAGREWADSSAVTWKPAYEAKTQLTLEQELGKNFFGLNDRGNVKVAIKDVENADFISFDKIEAALGSVQKSYWNFVFLYEALDIRREILEQAQRLYEIDQERFKHGLVERPQLLGSDANYQTKQADLALARNAVAAGGNVLKLQLNIDDDEVALRPAEKFVLPDHHVSLLDSMALALKNRRDYLKAMNEIERRDILLEMKKNSVWPEINIQASFARNGIGDDFTDAINKISEEDNPEFFASVSFSMPLENRAARSEKKQAEFQKARALLNAKYAERKVAIEIIDQVKACDVAYERLQYLVNAADLQTQKALEQEKIFKQGRSNSDIVIQYQDDALLARMNAASAFYDYYAAMIELKRREGTLLNVYWDGEI